jgi:hypothetical protein
MPARTAPYPSFTFSSGWALIAKGGLKAPGVLNYGRPGTADVNRPKAIAWAKSQGIVASTDESLDEYPFCEHG